MATFLQMCEALDKLHIILWQHPNKTWYFIDTDEMLPEHNPINPPPPVNGSYYVSPMVAARQACKHYGVDLSPN